MLRKSRGGDELHKCSVCSPLCRKSANIAQAKVFSPISGAAKALTDLFFSRAFAPSPPAKRFIL